jgi:glycosyltransferase involved in cell wall biosynthesis
MADGPLVEVRIPAYNRPDLLRRALLSVQKQTHRNWRAIVLDDGDADRTRQLVEGLADPRILHRPNRVRLGAGPNISLAFSKEPLAGGEFFYALEDDNLIQPSFIEDNLRLLDTHDVGLVVNNQWVEVTPKDADLLSPVHDIWVTIDCFTDGVWTAADYKIALLWRLPLSNSAVFWRRHCRSDLAVDDVPDAGIQEWVRCFRLDDAIYFNDTPNGFWRPESELFSYKSNIRTFLQEQRIQQIMRRRVLLALQARGELERVLSDRFKTPLPERERGLLKTYGRWPAASSFGRARRLELLAKALAVRWLSPQPPAALADALARWPSG